MGRKIATTITDVRNLNYADLSDRFQKCITEHIFEFETRFIMLLYNETIGIDKDIEMEWLQWMKNAYVPAMMKTGVFVDFKIYKIQHDNDDGSVSYSFQYFTTTIENLQTYLDVYAPTLTEELRRKYDNRHIVFRTLLEEI